MSGRVTRHTGQEDQSLQVQINALKRRVGQIEMVSGPPVFNLADPTAQITLVTQVGVATTGMRSDAAPPLDQTISPDMTGTWNYTPTVNTTPVTINGTNISSANLQTWNPNVGLDSAVTWEGSVAIGDEESTAMLSIRQRTVAVPANYLTFTSGTQVFNVSNIVSGSGADAWIYPSNTSFNVELLFSLDVSFPSAARYIGGHGSTTNGRAAWLIHCENGLFKIVHTHTGPPTGYSAITPQSSTDLRDGAWHHMGIIVQNSPRVVSLYIDGALIGSTATGVAPDDMATMCAFSSPGTNFIHFGELDTGFGTTGLSLAGLLVRSGTSFIALPTNRYELIPAGTIGSVADVLRYYPMTEGTGQAVGDLGLSYGTWDGHLGTDPDFSDAQDPEWATAPLGSSGGGSIAPLSHWKDSTGAVDSIVDEDIDWGIGTATPQEKWHLVGNARLDGYADFDEIATPATPSSGYARLYAKDKSGVSNLYFKKDDGTEIDLSGGTIVSGEWRFDTATGAADPGSGKLRFDNATIASITNVYIDSVSSVGIDVSLIIALMQTGDQFLVQDSDNAANRIRFDLSGAPTDNTGWWTIPVTYVSHIGALFANNQRLAVAGFMSGGGSGTGDILTDPAWANPGDLVVGTGAATAVILPVGTDGQILTADSGETEGVKWATLASGSGIVVTDDDFEVATVILEETLAGSQASFTTGTGLNAEDYDYIEIELFSRTDSAATIDTVNITFNSDTTNANYHQGHIIGGNASFEADADDRNIGLTTDSTAGSDSFGSMRIVIPKPSSADLKSCYSIGHLRPAAAVGYVFSYGVQWENTAEIDEITLTPVAGSNFVAGSYCIIKGFKSRTLVTSVTGGGAHDLLSAQHSDTVADTVVKGDLVVGNTTPAWERLPVGTNGFVLTADSAEGKGMKWAAPTGGGLTAADIDTSAEIAAIVGDETGSAGGGVLVFNNNPTLTALTLPRTTNSSTGIIFKDTGAPYRWMHDYTDPSDDDFPNLFVGKNAGNFTLNGSGVPTYAGTANYGFGENVLNSLTEGYSNLGGGLNALTSLTDGDFDLGWGEDSLASLTTGRYDIGVGAGTLSSLVSGIEDTAIGISAAASVTGDGVTAVGAWAGFNHTSGDGSIFIGRNSDSTVGTETNAIAIGDGTIVDADDKTVIGNLDTTVTELRGELWLRNQASGAILSTDTSLLTADRTLSFRDASGFVWIDDGLTLLMNQDPLLVWDPLTFGGGGIKVLAGGGNVEQFTMSINGSTGVVTCDATGNGGSRWLFTSTNTQPTIETTGWMKAVRYNKITLTEPATQATITIADNKTLTVNNSATLQGTGTYYPLLIDDAWAALGDLVVGTANNTAAILTVGADGYQLTADSGEATGLKWAEPNLNYVPTTGDTAINSVTDVQIVSNAVTGLVAGDQVVVDAMFTIINNSGAGRVYNITLDFDGAFAIEVVTASLTNSATAFFPMTLRAVLDIRSTSLAYEVVTIDGTAGIGQTSSTNPTMAATNLRAISWATSATDLTGSTNVTLHCRSANATATQTFRLHSFRIHKYSPT